MIPDSNVSAIHPAAGLPVVPTQDPVPTTPPSNAARDTSTKQQGQASQEAVSASEYIHRNLWLELEGDDRRLWQGQTMRGDIIGSSLDSYPLFPRLSDETFFVTDGEDFFTVPVRNFWRFRELHATKIFVEYSSATYEAYSMLPRCCHILRLCHPNSSVIPFFLYWVLFCRTQRFCMGWATAAFVERAMKIRWVDARSQERLQDLLKPVIITYNRHIFRCRNWGRALSGVLLYRLFRQQFITTTRCRHKTGLKRLECCEHKLPVAVMADLRRPVPGLKRAVPEPSAGIRQAS